jgi:hypothetical protein
LIEELPGLLELLLIPGHGQSRTGHPVHGLASILEIQMHSLFQILNCGFKTVSATGDSKFRAFGHITFSFFPNNSCIIKGLHGHLL